MTKAVGPKHKPDLWKLHAKSQVFSTAGLFAPPLPFFISFLSSTIPPSCPSPPLVPLQSMLSIRQKRKRKQNTKRHKKCYWLNRQLDMFGCCCVFRVKLTRKKRSLCSGKISSTCLKWKLVDRKRWRGAGATGGESRGLFLWSVVLLLKNKNVEGG